VSAFVPELLVRAHARRLKLPVMAGHAVRFAEEAASAGHGPLEFLAALLSAEVAQRDANVERARIAAARFPELKELSDFDFGAISSLNAVLVAELARGAYLERRETILAVGPPGTGKTHVATALGLAACRMGRRVRFVTVAGLVTELAEAQAEHRLSRLEASLDRLDLLICDELGFVRLESAWLLVAYCRLRKDVRTFRVDQITRLRPTGETYRPRSGFSFGEVIERERAKRPGS